MKMQTKNYQKKRKDFKKKLVKVIKIFLNKEKDQKVLGHLKKISLFIRPNKNNFIFTCFPLGGNFEFFLIAPNYHNPTIHCLFLIFEGKLYLV